MPYMKYGNWYIPGCSIAFPTEQEAWEYIEGINISCDTVDGVQYLGLSVDTPWYYNEKTRNMGQKKYEAILMKYISCVTDEKLEIKYWAANDDCDW